MAVATGVKTAHIQWDEKICNGCMSCVVVCSERHTGMSSTTRARIQVLVNTLEGTQTARYCRQCRNSPCAHACSEEAISYDEQVRVWIVDEARCTGCGQCVAACPFKIMHLDPYTQRAIKCDLCLGAARCVEICPTNALSVKG